MDRAGRRVGIMSVVIREGRGASLLAAISQFGSSVARSKPDFCVCRCPGKYSRAEGVFVDGSKYLVASGCSLPCLAAWVFSTAWS